jgi:ABC-2 type transport system ATP-binding protein
LPGVRSVEHAGPNHVRIYAERDVRSDAAAAVISAGGRLLRLSVETASLDLIYNRYFQNATGARHAA